MANTDLRKYEMTDEVKRRAAQVKQAALAQRESLTAIRERKVAGTKPPGAKPELALSLTGVDAAGAHPNSLRVVYSIEQHTEGWMAHFQLTCDRPRTYPLPAVVQEVVRLFGVTMPVNAAHAIEMEPISPAKEAVNIWFPINLKNDSTSSRYRWVAIGWSTRRANLHGVPVHSAPLDCGDGSGADIAHDP
jgi:hypothetical protein